MPFSIIPSIPFQLSPTTPSDPFDAILVTCSRYPGLPHSPSNSVHQYTAVPFLLLSVSVPHTSLVTFRGLRCFDPSCRSFSSPPLPSARFPSLPCSLPLADVLPIRVTIFSRPPLPSYPRSLSETKIQAIKMVKELEREIRHWSALARLYSRRSRIISP